MAPKIWRLGHDNELKHLEQALDALSTFEMGTSEFITIENNFITAFLRHFPSQDLSPALITLLVRLSARPLPSGRTQNELLVALKSLICAPSSILGSGQKNGPENSAAAIQNHTQSQDTAFARTDHRTVCSPQEDVTPVTRRAAAVSTTAEFENRVKRNRNTYFARTDRAESFPPESVTPVMFAAAAEFENRVVGPWEAARAAVEAARQADLAAAQVLLADRESARSDLAAARADLAATRADLAATRADLAAARADLVAAREASRADQASNRADRAAARDDREAALVDPAEVTSNKAKEVARMQIFVRIQTGEFLKIAVRPCELIESVRIKIQDRTRIPVNQQRLFDQGEMLTDGCTLRCYDIRDGSTLDVMLPMTGSIGIFKSDNVQTSALVQYLMGLRPDAPLEELRAKARECGVDESLSFFFEEKATILNLVQRKQIGAFMDFMWSRPLPLDSAENRVDLRMTISDEIVLSLLKPLDQSLESSSGYDSKSTLKSLRNLFGQVPGASGTAKIVLRQICGPTDACIAFHCDGDKTTSTSQIALNEPSEYKGGRLVFFVNDQLHELERPAGSVVQHPPKVLHGVTSLTHGKRQSLFVLDGSKGLGDRGDVVVTHEHIQQFLGLQCHSRIPHGGIWSTVHALRTSEGILSSAVCAGGNKRKRQRKCSYGSHLHGEIVNT